MAKRLRDICKLREDENYWRHGKGFVVRDLPKTEKQLREIPPFEFENWAVIALGGIPNKTQVGDMGIDGRIYPVSALPNHSGKEAGELDFMDDWYPIQVKQQDKVGRPDIDQFEAAMMRSRRKKGYFVGFSFSSDAMTEISQFFKREHISIVALRLIKSWRLVTGRELRFARQGWQSVTTLLAELPHFSTESGRISLLRPALVCRVVNTHPSR